jgi:hypothetical protein
MPLKVTAIANVGDGLNVDVTLSGAPEGELTFFASRLALDYDDRDRREVTGTDQGGNVYRVAVRGAAAGRPAYSMRLAYYVQVFDGATQVPSYQVDRTMQPAEETCAWVGKQDVSDWLDQTERCVTDILLDNLQALNMGMDIYLQGNQFPDGTPSRVQRLHSGIPAHSDGAKYPQISCRSYSIQDDPYFAAPRSDYLPITTQIAVYLCHVGKVNWEPLCRALGMAIFNILNQTHYVENDLDCGLRLYECYALTGGSAEEWDGAAGVYVASFTINWKSNLFVGQEQVG